MREQTLFPYDPLMEMHQPPVGLLKCAIPVKALRFAPLNVPHSIPYLLHGLDTAWPSEKQSAPGETNMHCRDVRTEVPTVSTLALLFLGSVLMWLNTLPGSWKDGSNLRTIRGIVVLDTVSEDVLSQGESGLGFVMMGMHVVAVVRERNASSREGTTSTVGMGNVRYSGPEDWRITRPTSLAFFISLFLDKRLSDVPQWCFSGWYLSDATLS